MKHRILAFLVVFAWLAVACAPPKLGPIANPRGVEPIKDVRYFQGAERDAWRHSADVYLPPDGAGWPVAVVVHGGAYVVNDKSVVDNIGYGLANAGIATVCPNYRLFPHARHPSQTMDVARAVAFAKRYLGERGARVDDFTLIGYSAGAAPVALNALDPKYLRQVGLDPDRDLTRVVVISGVYDQTDMPIVIRQVFTNRVATWRDASPINHVRANAPPFLILRAERDWTLGVSMREQSIRFHAAMEAVGARVTLREIPGCNHDFVEAQVAREPDSGTYRALMEFFAQTPAPDRAAK